MLIRTRVTLTIALLVIVITVPYVIAGQTAGSEYVFGGFLVNPIDGNSYLAKMQQGLEGGWKFQLTYSPPAGEGAYIFIFYIFLGHLARITSIPLIWIFHLARIISAIILMVVLWRFFRWWAGEDEGAAWKMFLLTGIGSGLGWLAALFGGFVSGDFWIAEAFPFLSMYTNPHFPLGLALILGMSLIVFHPRGNLRFISLPIFSLLLAAVQPFGMVVLVFPLVGFIWVNRERLWSPATLASIAALAPGGAYLVYQYAAIRADPALSVWNAQNVTPAPAVWDLFISISPAFLLALAGVYYCWKTKNLRGNILITWLLAGLVLIYLPFPLQRRFMTGLYVPVAGLAIYGIKYFIQSGRHGKWLWPLTIALSIITNLILLMGGLSAAVSKNPWMYLSKDEVNVLTWIKVNTPPHGVVLSSAEMGMFIPAWSGRNVVYGHPFESLNAEESRQQVESFFKGEMDTAQSAQFIADHQITLIFDGPREKELGGGVSENTFTALYQSGDVTLYGIQP